MICAGLTGGIGSGKSYVAGIFTHLGIPVYNADSKAKMISNTNRVVREKILGLFGGEAYIDGNLNNQFIGKLVFNDPRQLEKLNSIIHPEVEKDFRDWCSQNQTAPYLIKEAAILFETGSYKRLNCNILVTAPETIRIERVIRRDGLGAKDVKRRMVNQWKDRDKLKLADFVISNDGRSMVLPQVIEIHRELIENKNGKIR